MRKGIYKPAAILGPNGQPVKSQAYEGSSTSARLGAWGSTDISPTGADASELARLRNRSRDMERNTPWTNRAITADVANEIGTGIVPKATTPNKEFNAELNELHKDYIPFADADGVTNYYGIQAMGARARRESGEAFIRVRPRYATDGLPIPVQFQLIESDLCPASLTRKHTNGNDIKSGIEFNKRGQRVAYWFYRKYPADGGNLSDMVRVPAEQVIHHYIPTRPGQIRGRPVGVQAFVRAHTYDKYDDAELVRKESRASLTGVIRRPDFDIDDDANFDTMTGQPLEEGVSVASFELQAGTFPSLLPGEDIELFEGDKGSGDTSFARRQLLAMAAAYNVPYQLFTGDWSDVNDRVWRAIVNQYRRELEQIMEMFTKHQVARGMWNALVNYAVIGGVVTVPMDYSQKPFAYQRAKHTPQAWPYVHPTQDIESLTMEIEAGLDSRQNILAKRGRDAEQVDKERDEDQERERSLGLSSES